MIKDIMKWYINVLVIFINSLNCDAYTKLVKAIAINSSCV